MEEKDVKKERDFSVDLLRIIACIIVIATHLALNTYNIYEVQVDWSRLFTKCFLADGVGIFFLITGFFISNGRGYKKTIVSTIKKVVIPSIFVILFGAIFSKFLINQASLLECITSINLNTFKTMFDAIIFNKFDTLIPVVAHLWYVIDYLQIIIIAPLFYLLCDEKNSNSKLARRILIVLSLINILLIDIQKLVPISCFEFIENINKFYILDAKCLLVLLGYELYLKKDIIKNSKFSFIIGMLVFVCINFLRYKLEMFNMVKNNLVNESAFINWSTIFGIISACSLFVAVYSIKIYGNLLKKLISFFAPLTFGIYLVHFLIIVKVDIFKFEKISTFKFELLYMFLGTLIVFLVSALIVFCGGCFWGHFKKTTKKLLKKE